jgi:hypothetical protein
MGAAEQAQKRRPDQDGSLLTRAICAPAVAAAQVVTAAEPGASGLQRHATCAKARLPAARQNLFDTIPEPTVVHITC